MKRIPYGHWSSPIDASMVAKRGRINTLKWDDRGTLYFSGSSDGKTFLYSSSREKGLLRLNGELPVGGSVAYGGGDFDVAAGKIVFAAGKKGLHLRGVDQARSQKLTNDTLMTASPVISPDGQWLASVTSDGTNDQIALLRLNQRDWQRIWVQGADFYMQPIWSPVGAHFAWAEWNHPFMPWDAAKVMLAEVDLESGTIGRIREIAGGAGKPASQPQFSPDGGTLSFIRSNGEWEDLVLFDLCTAAERTLIQGKYAELTIPAFAQGIHTYEWTADGSQIIFTRIFGARTKLCRVDVATGEISEIETPGFASFDSLAVAADGTIAAIAAGPTDFAKVIRIDGNSIEVVYCLSEEEIDPEYISLPQEISWQSLDDVTIYGIYYRPANPAFTRDGTPPTFVHVHGGPTGKADLRLNPEIQYFTSRGFGWFEVNYRGSSGYGTTYRDSLNGNWGSNDVEDVLTGANCLGALGLADRSRMLVIGGSAGGFTVLNALCQFPESFKAGASLYGVSDLYSLAADTHKLELHYTDTLVGSLPEAEAKYQAWSPLFHADRIKAPLAIFQGVEDEVVIPAQAEELIAQLRAPFVYRLYEGEGHGFRQPQTIADYLETLTAFARKYL